LKLGNIKPLVEGAKSSFRGTASSKEELIASIENGYFTLDGRKMKDNVCFYGGKGLKSLIGMPEKARGNVFVGNNEIADLEGCPKEVPDSFRCSNNKLTSIKNGPTSVGMAYICSHNLLTDLRGCPETVNNLIADSNQITTLEGCPRFIQNELQVTNNKITSLHGIDSFIKMFSSKGTIDLTGNPVKECVLGVLLIPGLLVIRMDNNKVESILNEYLQKVKHLDSRKERNKLLMECQSIMLDAGLDDFAQL